MTRVALTGAGGFLGWHTRAALRATGVGAAGIALGSAFDLGAAVAALTGADRVVHLAGVNRGSDAEVIDGNEQLAQQLAEAIRRAPEPPPVIVFANSIQAGRATPYGTSKARASDILQAAAADSGATYVDIELPNIFGEHGRPFYNSVVATFSHQLANGGVPRIEQDARLSLLHAQYAADQLIGAPVEPGALVDLTVSELLERLTVMARTYDRGDIPSVADPFDRDLFNTYRSFAFAQSPRIPLVRRADQRGAFFEVIRSHGGAGQSSFSTTVPGVARGDHFHRRKIERFTVLSGRAVISVRRLFSSEVLEFAVDGSEPSAIDMPTMWAHRIVNTGDQDLYTSFWSNEIFDPESPDTYAEEVRP